MAVDVIISVNKTNVTVDAKAAHDVGIDTPYELTPHRLGDHTDSAALLDAIASQYLKFDGTDWVPATPDWMTTSHPANSITNTLITNWDSAYSLAHSAVTIGTANGLSVNGQIISLQTAGASQPGALSSGDWNTFNSKQAALTFASGITNTANTVTNNLITGISGGQTVTGGIASGENLTLQSTSHATKGSIFLGTQSRYEQTTRNLQIGRVTSHQTGIELYMDNNAVSFGLYPTISINNPNISGYMMYSHSRGDGVNNIISRWITDPNNDVTFGSYTSGKNLRFVTKNVTRITIKGDGTNDGFVGINLTPTYRFDVQSGSTTENVFSIRRSSGARMMEFTEAGGVAKWGLFGVTPVIQQAGGAATAGAAYTANEQTMLQTLWNMARAYGQLT
ncbi:MAG: hypothetical protein F9K23_00650 [Bacteroidetes bacterium]|nr:MAG: hypothetical protein F9K23_00650 [Bacteroidota bacterium]